MKRRPVWMPPLLLAIPCRLPAFVAGLALQAAVLLFGIAPEAASDLVVSDEIVIDPGTRSYDPYGLRTWVDLAVCGDRVLATWGGSSEASGGGFLYSLDSLGVNDGVEYPVTVDSDDYLLQAMPWGDGWAILEANAATTLRLSRSSARTANPQDRIVLEPVLVQRKSVQMEALPDGSLLVVWRVLDGRIRSAHIAPSSPLAADTQTIAEASAALDFEFGPDGGILAWLIPGSIDYIVLDANGSQVSERRSIGVPPGAERVAGARSGDYLLYAWHDEISAVSVVSLDAATGALMHSSHLPSTGQPLEMVSTNNGAFLLLQGSGAFFDEHATLLRRIEDLRIWTDDGQDPASRWFDVAWTGSHVVCASVRLWLEVGPSPSGQSGRSSIESGAGASANRRYCFTQNFIHSVVVSAEDGVERTEEMNAVYRPREAQPWFQGDDLHLLLHDAISSSRHHVQVQEDGAFVVLEAFAHSGPCDYSLRTDMGIAEDGRFVTLDRESTWDRFRDYVYDWSSVLVIEPGAGVAQHGCPLLLSREWDVAIVRGLPWAVSNRGFDAPNFQVCRLEPEPVRFDIGSVVSTDAVQILDLGNRPWLVWHAAEGVRSGFVSEDGSPFAVDTLIEGSGYYLLTAAEGGTGGLLVLSLRLTADDRELLVVPVTQDGRLLGEPQHLSVTHHVWSAHAIWNGERYLVSWVEYVASTGTASVKIARVAPRGAVLDPGGIEVAAPYEIYYPYLAAGTNGRSAIAYGNRVRFLEDATPIVASGPFAESVTQGIQLTWTLGEGEIEHATLERAEGDRGDDPPFATLAVLTGLQLSQPYVDSTVESGRSYLYRLRLVARDGEEVVLGPIAARWSAGAFLDFDLRPNPAGEFLSLSLHAGSALPDRIEILDVQGRVVLRLDRAGVRRLLGPGAGVDLSPHLAALSSGTYWVRATGSGMESVESIRIVK